MAARKPSGMSLYRRLLPWVLIMELYWLSYKLLERRLYPTDVSVSQARVLGLLYYADKPMKPSLVATLLMQERQNITSILQRIENKGWVQRKPDPEDRRAIGLELTEKGRKLTKEAVVACEDLYKEFFSCLDEKERKTLEEILRKLRSHGLYLPETDIRMRRAGLHNMWKA